MKWFLGTYIIRFKRRHREFGHVFSGRYKALIVDGGRGRLLGRGRRLQRRLNYKAVTMQLNRR
jgi:hypothetical protein